MRKTLQQQIASNERASIFLGLLLMLILGGLGAAIVGSYEPDMWLIGGLGALTLGFVASLIAWSSGDNIILAMSGVREADRQEHLVLDNVAEEMAIAAGIPKPRVFVVDDPSPNAFATGKNPKNGVVVFTTGILHRLNREELQGVMAHEIAHIRNNDIKFMTTIALIAGLVPLLADFFLRMQWFGGGRRRDSDSGGNQLQLIFFVVAIALSILAPLFTLMIKLAVSRNREYMADATAAQVTRNPDGLANALIKLHNDPGQLERVNRGTEHMYIVSPFRGHSDRGSALFSTHPPMEERIRRLKAMAGSRTSADFENV